MSAFDLLVTTGWGVMCGVWTVLLWMQIRAGRDGTILSARSDFDASGVPAVTVVVPACNEENDIAGCLDTILSQKIPAMRVIVVDDRSDDDTAAIVQSYASRDPRVELHSVERLPEGWLGKSHALWSGTRDVDTEWLLFLDADCRLLSSHAIGVTVREAQARGASLLTVWPRLNSKSFWESFLIPLCSAIIALWFGRSNTRRAPAFGNGQFMLMRQEDYEAIGSHASVRRAIIEDVPIAQAMRQAGFVTWTAGGRDLVAVRMYDSLHRIMLGWSRIFVGALRSPVKIAASIAWLLTGSLLPFVALPYLLAQWWQLTEPASLALIALTGLCINHLVLLMLVSYRFWGLGGCDRRFLWLYPLSALGVLIILTDALWAITIRRRIGWRATSYRFDRRAMIITSPPAGRVAP